jgi:hypothetical protein
MIKSKVTTAIAALLLAFGTAGSANAFSITAGNIKFTIDNYDSGTTGYGTGNPVCASVLACNLAAATPAPGSSGSSNPGADTVGIFSIANISNTSTGQTIFSKGVNGYITGVFGNLSDWYVTVDPVSGLTKTKSVGGTWAMFQNATEYNASLGPLVAAGKDLNNLQYPGISDTGTLFLKGVFGAGAIFGDTTTTYTSLFDTNTFGGNGQGFLDITGGDAGAVLQFDTNKLTDPNGGKHDMFLTTTFDDVNGDAAATGWTVTSAGQIKAAATPEPGALALVALALVGAGLASRRRQS